MNFRKIVSAFSALAISVSAFAGLAVTANADDSGTTTTTKQRVYYVGSADGAEDFTNYTGTVFTASGTVDEVSSFSGVSTTASGGTLPKLGGTITTATAGTIASGEYPTYVNGQVWRVQDSSGTASTYDLVDTSISKGTVYISTDIALAYNRQDTVLRGQNFSVLDSNGADILKINYSPGKDKYSVLNITGSKSDNTGSKSGNLSLNFPERNVSPVGFHVDATIDLDKKTAKVTIDYIDVSDFTRKTTNVSLVISNDNVKSIRMQANPNSNKPTNSISLDNTLIYNEYEDDGTVAYKVNYIDESGNTLKSSATYYGTSGSAITLSENDTATFVKDGIKYVYASDTASEQTISSDGTTEVNVVFKEADKYTVTVQATGDGVDETLATGTVYAGDEFTYSFSKYLTDENGKVKAYTDETTFTKTVTPTETTTVEIPFTAYSGDAWFVENSLGSTGYSHSNLSGGSASRGASSATKIFTVTESGIYKITTRAFSNNTNAERTYKIAKNDASVDANILANVSLASKSINYVLTTVTENISLDANDVIYIVPSDTQVCLDYTLLEKTAELTYDITATQPDNGNLTVSPTTAAEGDTVTVTATANTGYEVKSVSAAKADGSAVAVTGADGTYTFTMPASAVTVSAVIEAIPTTPDPSVAFETISDSEKESDGTYKVGFLSTIKSLTDADGWTVTDAGFTFANISNDGIETNFVSVKPESGTLDLKTDESFSYIFQNIANTYTAFGIKAIPYVVLTNAENTEKAVTVQGTYVDGDNKAFKTTTETTTTNDGTTADE